MSSSDDVVDGAYTLSFPYNMHIVCKISQLFFTRNLILKKGRKYIGVFEKHADDVTSGCLILPKNFIDCAKLKLNNSNSGDSKT